MAIRKYFITIALIFISVAMSEVIHRRITAGPVLCKNGTLTIEGYNAVRIPGTPVLPAQSVVLALPAGGKVVSVILDHGPFEELMCPGLRLAPPSLPLCLDQNVTQEAVARWRRNTEYLNSMAGAFPARPAYVSRVSHLDKIPFVRVTFFPVQWDHGKLFSCSYIDITITLTREEPADQGRITPWIDDAADLFTNWDDVRGSYEISMQEDSFEYVIITKDQLFSAFDSLVAWKNTIGFTTRLVSYDSILALYPGAQAADKIRNFLIDKYEPWGIRYVLIAGNVDNIPMKVCFPDPGHHYDTPTDYYYAELTDDWDGDNDGYYGEYEEDSIGFMPEILVGRFPYNDVSTLTQIVQKTVDFERDVSAWKNRALLLAAFNNFENEDGLGWPACDGAALMEYMKDSLLAGWTYTRMYEEEGLCPSSFPHEQALTQSNVVAEWSSGTYAVTNWSGHGNSSGAYRKYWIYDDGDSIPEGEEMAWQTFIDISDPPSLDDEHPSIIFASSCSNAEGSDNLARALIAQGSSGIVAATSYGWYTPGWDDPSIGNIMSLDYYFYYYLLKQGQRVGDALFSSKMYYFNYLYFPDPWGGDPEWTPQQNMLDYNLFGDPALAREGVGIVEQNAHSIVSPAFCVQPNPVRSNGCLSITMPYSADVAIDLYNLAGQQVQAIYHGKIRSGLHSLPFSCTDLANGVYFLTMEYSDKSDQGTRRHKIIVVH
ncbi:hypothetical protein JXB22_00110 [candidate division WOR-3 bacterium]|nr:hypothetical protein [candidate division WOR-3 bacterium]